MSPDKPSKISQTIKRIRNAMRHLFVRNSGKAKRADSGLAVNQVLKARETKALPSVAQLAQLPKLLTETEKRIAALAFVTIVITGSILGIKLFNSQRVDVASSGGEYTEGFIGSPQLINPLYSQSSDVDNDLAHLMYSGLMRYDSEIGLTTDLAESYEISEDRRTYTLTLRENAKWHDGRPVRVDDIIFTISAIQNVEYLSPLYHSFSGITVNQKGDRTVEFTLSESFNPFLSLLTVGILPSHLWQDIPPVNASVTELNKKPIGSGPFKFEKLEKDQNGIRSYTLKSNADFYRDVPRISKLIIKFYPDVTSAIEALRNQNIEGISYLPPEVIDDFANESKLTVFSPTLHQYTAAFFNQKRNPVLADDAVRKALSESVDRKQVIEDALNGKGKVTKSFILEGMLGEHTELEVPEFNIDAAKATLEEADWKLEEGSSIRKKDDQTLTFEIVTLNAPELMSTAKTLQAQWSELGAEITIRAVSNTEFQSVVLRDRAYDVLISGELYGIDPDPYAFWHSSQSTFPGYNLAQFSNRKADEFIETGRNTSDSEARAEAYRKLQELVLEDNAAIFIYQPTYSFALPSKLRGVEVTSIISPADRFSTITNWFIKSRKIFSN